MIALICRNFSLMCAAWPDACDNHETIGYLKAGLRHWVTCTEFLLCQKCYAMTRMQRQIMAV